MLKKAFLLGCIIAALSAGGCLLPGKNVKKGAGDSGVLTEENNLLGNSTFAGKTYLPWTTSFTSPGIGTGKIQDGAFCVDVDNKGVNNWDAQFRHREMVIERGHRYYLQFKIWASQNMMAPPLSSMTCWNGPMK